MAQNCKSEYLGMRKEEEEQVSIFLRVSPMGSQD
jgi:hypothetical protein